MALIRCGGLEIEFTRGTFYAKISSVGEIWIETNAIVRGRRWADYMFEEGTLHLFFGKTYIVANRPYAEVSAQAA